MTICVPTIDISGLPTDRVAMASIATALETWGFLQITGHGISQLRRARFLDQARTFFNLPAAAKQAVLRDVQNPMGFYDRELTKNTPDWKQVFDYGIDRRDADDGFPSRWPAELEDFESEMLAWYDACEQISTRLLRAIARAMEIDEEILAGWFYPVNTSFVRLNYYPVCRDPAPADSDSRIVSGHLGVNRHTDAGMLTVLVQDDVPALQVNRAGRWYTIEPEPDGLIINAGDMLQVWSNDRFKAPEHRVIARSDRERFSAPYFFNPAFSTTCEPLAAAAGEAHYRPVNWRDFRTQRATGDYANYGHEIQISDFRL